MSQEKDEDKERKMTLTPTHISVADKGDPKVTIIYQGFGGDNRVAPDLAIDMDIHSRTYCWLLALHPDGIHWITVADLSKYIFFVHKPSK